MALFLAPLVLVTDPVVELTEEDGVTPFDPPQFSEPVPYLSPGVEIVGNWSGIPAPGGLPWILIDAPAMVDAPAGGLILEDGMATPLSNADANKVGQAYGLTNAQTRALRGVPVGEALYTVQYADGVEPVARGGKRRMGIGNKLIHEVDG